MARRGGLGPKYWRDKLRIEEALKGTPTRETGTKYLQEISRRTTPQQQPTSLPEYFKYESTELNTTDSSEYGSTQPALDPSHEDFALNHVEFSNDENPGPVASSRVESYQFTPIDWNDHHDGSLQGRLKVSWHFPAKGRADTSTVYGPLPLSAFKQFRNSSSLGRAVRGLESYGFVYAEP